jgi:rod shape-determining protein MreD
MSSVIGIPILIITAILQMVVFSRINLLHGSADLMLLVLVAWALQERVKNPWVWTIIGGLLITFVSAVPDFAPFVGYLVIVIGARLFHRRVWQTPLLTMLVVTMFGSIAQNILYLVMRQIAGVNLSTQTVLSQVILPSILLNLLLATPIYLLISDLSNLIFPEGLKV